jgi:hypothetical protein
MIEYIYIYIYRKIFVIFRTRQTPKNIFREIFFEENVFH